MVKKQRPNMTCFNDMMQITWCSNKTGSNSPWRWPWALALWSFMVSSVRSICHRQQVLGKGIHADSCVAPWNPITRTSTSITSCIFSVNTVTHSKPPAEAAWHWGPGSVRCRSPRSEPQNQWNPQAPASYGILRHPAAAQVGKGHKCQSHPSFLQMITQSSYWSWVWNQDFQLRALFLQQIGLDDHGRAKGLYCGGIDARTKRNNS